jgi:hypothetical protein
MKNKSISVLLVLFLSGFLLLNGQTGTAAKDKYTLLTMPYIQKPLLLYKGQVQINTGYKFAVRGRSFDNNGNVIVLKDDGNSSVLHYYFAEVRYGVTDFLEVGAETNYMKRGIRSESTTTITTTDQISTNDLKEFRGMSDLLLFASVRPPIEYKWFDFALRGGYFMPSAKYEPAQPTHTVITDAASANSFTVNYHFNNKNGFGVPVYFISAMGKLTFSKFAFETDFMFREPIKEATNIRWEETLIDKVFSYYNKPYQYLLDRTITFNASVHYQPIGWFNVFVNTSWFKTSGGWTEYWGNKYRNPEMKLFTLEPGFEIQISPTLTIYQVAGIPLSGQNAEAPFYLFTTLSFNLFPFSK